MCASTRAEASSTGTVSKNVRSGRRPPVTRRFQSSTGLLAEPARESLVGNRGVEVAVADDVASGLERRTDLLGDELGACRGKERDLGPGDDLPAAEHELPDPFPELRAARLAEDAHGSPLSLEELREPSDLGRFPRSVDPFEADEERLPHPVKRMRVPGRRLGGSLSFRLVQTAVTGGAGFIGSTLVDALVGRGDEVVVIDDLSFGKPEQVNPAARLLERDIRDGLELDGIDLVFHLAAKTDVTSSLARPAEDASVNVLGTVRVLEAALAAGVQVVFTSTGGAIYGECERPADEDSPRRPLSPYGIAKLCAEEYLGGWNRIHGSRHAVVRLANVYGPRQASSLEGGVVSIFFDRFVRGEETVIFGDGGQTRDFVYVGDVVAALLAAAGHDGGVFNVGSGEETTVLELHGACAELAGAPNDPELRARPPGRRAPLGARRLPRGADRARLVGADVARRRSRGHLELDERSLSEGFGRGPANTGAPWTRR